MAQPFLQDTPIKPKTLVLALLRFMAAVTMLLSCTHYTPKRDNTKEQASEVPQMDQSADSSEDTVRPTDLKSINPSAYLRQKVDTAVLLRQIAYAYGFEQVYSNSGSRIMHSTILFFKAVHLSDGLSKATVLYFEHPEGGTGSLPNRMLCVFDSAGKLLLQQSHCGMMKPLIVQRGARPYLLATEETGKGNGTHRLYGFRGEQLVNVLNTNDWDIHTVDGHTDDAEYDPTHMKLQVRDLNKDGHNDLRFSTTLVLYCAERIKRKKLVYDFHYHPSTHLFEPAGDYLFENISRYCK